MSSQQESEKAFTVGIIGAGIGGLCLAQGLQKRGIKARVFERDPTPNFRRQGYRVTVHASGLEWLKACLPEPCFARVQSASTLWSGAGILNDQLRLLRRIDDVGGASRSVDRRTLRDILLEGLDGVSFSKEFIGYREIGESVEVQFADGERTMVDILVGADGNQSRVRKQLLPEHAELRDTGFSNISVRMPWSDQTKRWTDELGALSLAMISTSTSEALIIIPQIYNGSSDDQRDSFLYWGLVAARSRIEELGGDADDGESLLKTAKSLAHSYHPLLRDMIDAASPAETTLLRFLTSVRHVPWKTRRVTLLGDAIHSMSPMAGAGANTAMRDAGELAVQIEAVELGKKPLLVALAEFEATMLEYGFAAVDNSQLNLERATSGMSLRQKQKGADNQ